MTTATIVGFVNQNYVEIARNWLVAIDRLGLGRRALLVTLDEAAQRALSSSDVRLLHRPLLSGDLNDLWVHRVKVLSELLLSGIDVVHSDVDAVWLSDPLPEMSGSSLDLVFSQGTVWPPDVHRNRGFVMCCGLYFVRNSPGARLFFKRFAERVAIERDDQAALNRLLDEWLGEWAIREPYRVRFGSVEFVCSRVMMLASGPDLSVGVLPHHSYPRLMSGLEGVMVAHPLSGQTSEETRAVLRQGGLWFL
jgi:hypothetical protein